MKLPFVYASPTADVAANFTTSGSANTAIDAMFIKPGTRNVVLFAIYAGGKGAGLSTISGIEYQAKKYTSTASSGGTGVTPHPSDPGAQAAKATAGAASAGVTTGTGGPTIYGTFISGAAGPGSWVASNPDEAIVVEGSANQSADIHSTSGQASLNYSFTAKHAE